eukprot:Em0021g394a
MAAEGSNSTLVRVDVPALKTQKCVVVNLYDSVWGIKNLLREKISQELPNDFLNYGIYLPGSGQRLGKYLDDSRALSEYVLQGNVPKLELRYKSRDYSGQTALTEKAIAKANTKANQKKLLEYIALSKVDKISSLLESGLDPNFVTDEGNTPLGLVCGRGGQVQLLTPLLTGGAHIDFRGKEGLTALHRAAIGGNDQAINVLLSYGASPNYRDNKGLTALYHTVIMGDDTESCEALLKYRAEIGLRDQGGWTELHQVAKYGHIRHGELLIRYGADLNAQNSVGNTPLHVAASYAQKVAQVYFFGVIAAPKQAVSQALSIIQELWPTLGMFISAAKCELDSLNDNLSMFPSQMKISNVPHFEILGTPIGDAIFCAKVVSEKCTTASKLLTQLEESLWNSKRPYSGGLACVSQINSCPYCPANSLDTMGHLAVTCKHGGDIVTCHNRLRDVFVESCRRACIGVQVKLSHAHLSVKVEAGNNLTPDHSHTRPADVLVQNWSRGRPAAFDICVTSPLNTLTLSEARVCAGAAAQAGELSTRDFRISWKKLSSMPVGMQNAQARVLGNKIYVGGGTTGMIDLSSKVYVYDYIYDKWEILSKSPVYNFALEVYDSSILLIGGRDTDSGEVTGEVFFWNQAESIWKEDLLPSMPTARHSASSATYGQYIVVAGGFAVTVPVSNVEVYSSTSQQWLFAHPLPLAQSHMKQLVNNGNWMLTGGSGNEGGTHLAFSASLDTLISKAKEQLPLAGKEDNCPIWITLPQVPHLYCSIACLGNLVVVLGKEDSTLLPIFAYNSIDQSWMFMSELPFSCQCSTTVSIPGGALVLLGGVTYESSRNCSVSNCVQLITFHRAEKSDNAHLFDSTSIGRGN